MSFQSIVIVLFIHLLVPLGGLLIYLQLLRKLNKENLNGILGFYFFILFVTYVGLLMVLLTSILWKWSGLASLGTFYLLLLAPILMVFIIYRNRQLRSVSKYHEIAFKAALIYLILFSLMLVITCFFEV
jgi:hypothetical protein